ncbi:MAG: DUF4392 domain-containing protein [Euryarchaeota archaeon]|nr:DUF4392 domain-containing protein [Euryarchaeota archaeon]
MQEVEALLQIANIDLGQRGIGKVFSEAYLSKRVSLTEPARKLLEFSDDVTILVGFPIPPKGIGETDGPLGALCLALALEDLGINVKIVSEKSVFNALKSLWEKTTRYTIDITKRNKVIVSIEVPGRAMDGKYYSMRGIEIFPENLDEVLFRKSEGQITIGIGDGGNEAGMGKIRDLIIKHIDLGEKISSVVPADYIITGGTSNWAAYALVGAISVMISKNLLKKFDENYYLRALYESGLIDGVIGEKSMSVDGIPHAILEKMFNLIKSTVDMLINK